MMAAPWAVPMRSLPPSRSLPPPKLPTAIVANARLKTLAAESAAAPDDRARALLAYETGAVHEQRLHDATQARAHYEQARALDPTFQPALFSLMRLLADGTHGEALAALWEAAEDLAPTPQERALALTEHGIVLHDTLGSAHVAAALWDEALEVDPGCQAAALLLEHHHRANGRRSEGDRVMRLRARALGDAELRATLALELAEDTGDPGEALALLDAYGAGALPDRTLERISAFAHEGQRWTELVRILEERARRADAFTAAALLREAGRLRANRLADLDGARESYAQAAALAPGDASIPLEQMHRSRRAGDADAERAAIAELLRIARDGDYAALLHLRLAEIARTAGDAAGAEAEAERALRLAPNAAQALARVEEAHLQGRRFAALRELGVARAERAHGAARAERNRQTARLALEELDDVAGARALLDAAREGTDDAIGVARDRHGAALLAADAAAASDVARELEALAIDDDERAVLLYQRWLHASSDESHADAAKSAIESALDAAACGAWAPDAARAEALLRADAGLLARAHDALGARAGEDETFAAHACAAARALLRVNDANGAVSRLEAALARRPGDAYAVVLLETARLARGDAPDEVRAWREAAETRARRERSLLDAGAAAEAEGDAVLAARNYADASDRDPTALAPAWALRRLAERAGDETMRLDALGKLARREAALGMAGLAHLEFGEGLDGHAKAVDAADALTDALSESSVRLAAALDLLLLPTAAVSDETFDAAIGTLAERCSGASLDALAREAAAQRHGAPRREGSTAPEVSTRDDVWTGFRELDRIEERGAVAHAFARIAAAAGGTPAAAEHRLHAARVAALAGLPDAGGWRDASRTADAQTASLIDAVDRDEALTDDPELRAGALFARLAHCQPVQGATLRAARARALLDADRPREAADLARRAVDEDASATDAWEVLLTAARRLGDAATLIEAAERVAARTEGAQRALLCELAATTLVDEIGLPAEAEERLLAALDADPTSTTAFDRLHDLLLERRDVDGMRDLVVRTLAATTDPAARVDLLWERALIERAKSERDVALATLDQVLALDPEHVGALGLRVEIHTSLKEWRSAVDALRSLANAPVPDQQKRLARLGIADFLERHLDDPTAAYAELVGLVDDGFGHSALHERMARLARRAGLYAEAAREYERAAVHVTGAERAAFEREAARIHETQLGAMAEAAAAYARALAAWPTDIEALHGLFARIEPGQRNAQLRATRNELLARLTNTPAEPELLRALGELGRVGGDAALERTALASLAALRVATEAEDRAWRNVAPPTSRTVLTPLPDKAFDALHTEHARGLGADACLLIAAAAAAPEPKHRTPASAPEDVALRESLTGLLGAFGLSVAAVEAAPPGDAHMLAPRPARGAAHTWIRGDGVRAPLSSAQRFSVARQAMGLRLGILPLLERTPAERRDWIRAAVALATDAGGDDRVRALVREIEKRLPRADRKGLARMITSLGGDATEIIERSLRALEWSCLRAGTLFADDPAAAIGVVLGGAVEMDAVRRSPEALELLRFWVSPTRLVLARALEARP